MEIINSFFKIKRFNYSIWAENISLPINTPFYTGVNELEPFFENVSLPIQHLVMTKSVSKEFLKEIEEFTKIKYPDTLIDWESTQKMVNYVLEYKKLCSEKITLITQGKEGRSITVTNPVRIAKIYQIEKDVLKYLNDKYKPGMYSLPSVPPSH